MAQMTPIKARATFTEGPVRRRFVPLRPTMRTSILADSYDAAKERAWHLSIWASTELNAWCVHEVATGRCVALSSDHGMGLPDEAHLPKRPMSVSFIAA